MVMTSMSVNTPNYNDVTRAYLLDLKAGRKPDIRPDVGPEWAGLVAQLEEKYIKLKGSPAAMARLFQTYEQQYPVLADLLQSSPARVTEVRELGFSELPESARIPPEASQGACPELDCYVEYSKKASPEAWDDFHPFTGMWGFSAVSAGRVKLEMGPHDFYTNLYVVLCARTTLIAKTATANLVQRLLYEIGLDHLLIDDQLTPQRLLSEMSGATVPSNFDDMSRDEQEDVRHRLAMPGQRVWYYDEIGLLFQSMLRKGSTNVDFRSIFLKFDGCPPRYSSATLMRGREPIKHPFLTVLGTAAPSNIWDLAKRGGAFWQDGFWARFSFLTPPPDFVRTSTWGMDRLPIPNELKASLRAWHERLKEPECRLVELPDKKGEPSGKYRIDREDVPVSTCRISQDAYMGYKNYREALRTMMAANSNQDLDGNYGRLPETAMRMAVIMASLSNNNRIELRHWAKAQELAETLRKNLHELYAQVNSPDLLQESAQGARTIEDTICKHLAKHGPMTVNQLRTRYLKNNSTKQIQDALRGLKQVGLVEDFSTPHAPNGGKYRLVEQTEDQEEEE